MPLDKMGDETLRIVKRIADPSVAVVDVPIKIKESPIRGVGGIVLVHFALSDCLRGNAEFIRAVVVLTNEDQRNHFFTRQPLTHAHAAVINRSASRIDALQTLVLHYANQFDRLPQTNKNEFINLVGHYTTVAERIQYANQSFVDWQTAFTGVG